LKTLVILLMFTACLSAQDWKPLFNGRDTEGWELVGDGNFIVEIGLLKSQGGMGLLWYTGQKFGVVKLRIIYKGADKNNAGVFIRIPETPEEAWMPVNKGYEVQLDDREDELHKTGLLYSLTKARATPDIAGDWNAMEITLEGNRTIVYVNGVLVTDYTGRDSVPEKVETYEPDRGPRPEKGYIGLQNHSEEDEMHIREVSVKELNDYIA
jgi:hypothetical protein